MGLEPTTAAMARRYSSQLSYARTSDILYIFVKMQEKIKNFHFASIVFFCILQCICHVANQLLYTGHSSHMNSRIL